MKLLIAALLMSVSAAYADETSKVYLDFPAPVNVSVPDALLKDINISDFTLGMSLDEVNAILESKYSKFQRSEENRPLELSAGKGGFTINGKTQQFTNTITIWFTDDNNAQDIYSFHFTSPRTGARLFDIARLIKYDKATNKPMLANVENSIYSKWPGLSRDVIQYDGSNPAFRVAFYKELKTDKSNGCEDIRLDEQYFRRDDIKTIQRNGAKECYSTLSVDVGLDRARNVLTIRSEGLAKVLFWKSANSDLSWFLDVYDKKIQEMKAEQTKNAVAAPAL